MIYAPPPPASELAPIHGEYDDAVVLHKHKWILGLRCTIVRDTVS